MMNDLRLKIDDESFLILFRWNLSTSTTEMTMLRTRSTRETYEARTSSLEKFVMYDLSGVISILSYW